MDISQLNLNNQSIREDHLLANTRAYLDPGRVCLIPRAVRTMKKIPGWKKTLASHMASPKIGAEFLESELTIQPGGGTENSLQNHYENCFFVLEGMIEVAAAGRTYVLEKEGFIWIPPEADFSVASQGDSGSRILWVKKTYEKLEKYGVPDPVAGNVSSVPGIQSQEDFKQFCLPYRNDCSWDMGMNVFTYHPGVTMPHTETHICEHGNYVLSGRGFIWINGEYAEIYPGDFWFVSPYTPHTAAGLAPTSLRYLCFRNANREFIL